ncbi:MAG: PTS sugar transporter subunit IIA [Deltaproteobacteria bacterium]|nr:PTS sugar transporter subunit IIA [Deltaproteobacteria bacterium]
MIGIVVAAHGRLAEALVTTARTVVPDLCKIEAVGITEKDDAAGYDIRLHEAVTRVAGERGVLVLTDMFGGTPSNVGLAMHQTGKVEVLTGANLPMLIKAIQLAAKNTDLASTSRQVKEYGQRSIAVASEVLGGAESTASGGRHA